MSKPWFRLHRKLLNNRKVRSLKPELFQAWVFLLCCTDDDGVLKDLADVAFEMRVTEDKAQQLIDALVSAGMFDVGANGQITARDWTEHNPPSDSVDATAAERNRKYRERRKQERNDRNGDGVTTVTATALDTDTDTDKKKTDLDAHEREARFFEGFKKFWEVYPTRPTDREGAAEDALRAAADDPEFPGIDAVLAAIGRWKYARSLESAPGNPPYASTWLAEKRWRDWPEPPPPEPHKRDWAEAYPDTWGKLKASVTPNEWAFWLGKCMINGSPHVLICPDKLTREKIEQKHGQQIAAMFGGKGVVKVLGEQQGVAA